MRLAQKATTFELHCRNANPKMPSSLDDKMGSGTLLAAVCRRQRIVVIFSAVVDPADQGAIAFIVIVAIPLAALGKN